MCYRTKHYYWLGLSGPGNLKEQITYKNARILPTGDLEKKYYQYIRLDTTTEVLPVYIKFGFSIYIYFVSAYRFVVSSDINIWFKRK